MRRDRPRETDDGKQFEADRPYPRLASYAEAEESEGRTESAYDLEEEEPERWDGLS